MTSYSVKVNNVSKVYKSEGIEVDALIGVSFSLRQGEFVAIVGPSGSGKSTLMHLLGTIDKPTSGDVYIDGTSTTKMGSDQLSDFRNKKLGFVFQAYNLVNGVDVETNVELPLMVNNIPVPEMKKRAERILKDLSIGDKAKLKPQQLSGGQQQRVAIARALVNDPTLVLADEPTGNLDTKSGDEVIRLFRDICRNRNVTIVMVTHNPDITRRCNRVIHIKDGRLEKEEVLK